jgi:hypothetical protein
MKVTVVNNIDLSKAFKLIKDDKFWLTAAQNWQRILKDYIPKDTGQLRRNVDYRPGEIEYKEPYSRYIYFGMKMVDPSTGESGTTEDGGITWRSRRGIRKVQNGQLLQLKNGSRLWDKKAISEKKDLILIRSMQNYIDKNL